MAEFETIGEVELSFSTIDLSEYELCFLAMVATYNPPRADISRPLARLKTAGSSLFLLLCDFHQSLYLLFEKNRRKKLSAK